MLEKKLSIERKLKFKINRHTQFHYIENMFSVFVKRKIFTKHIGSQWTAPVSFRSKVIAAVQPLARQHRIEIERGGRPELFSEYRRAPAAGRLPPARPFEISEPASEPTRPLAGSCSAAHIDDEP